MADFILSATSLEDVLADNGLEERDVLSFLIKAGLIETPDWCEAPDIDEEE